MKKLFKIIFSPDGKNMIPEEQDAIEFLILNKALEVSGVDAASGEILYSFTPKIKELMPDLYKEHMNHVNGEVMRLWEKGFLNIDFFAEEPIVTLAEKAFDLEEVDRLPKQDKWVVEEMKRLMKRRNF